MDDDTPAMVPGDGQPTEQPGATGLLATSSDAGSQPTEQTPPTTPDPIGPPVDAGATAAQAGTAAGVFNSASKRSSFDPRTLDRTVIAVPLLRELEAESGESAQLHAVVIEINLDYRDGRLAARDCAIALLQRAIDQCQPTTSQFDPHDAKNSQNPQSSYLYAQLDKATIRTVVQLDNPQNQGPQQQARERCIHRIWPDFQIKPLTYISVTTVKADAARSSFSALGKDIAWAVLDSGIQGTHPHFQLHQNLSAGMHKDFTVASGEGAPLRDAFGHGTHVAGIIAGEMRAPAPGSAAAAQAPAGLVTANASAAVTPVATTANPGEGNPGKKPSGVSATSGRAAAPVATAPALAGAVTAPVTAPAVDGAPVPLPATTPQPAIPGMPPIRAFTHYRDENGDVSSEFLTLDAISGMAPLCKLVSLKVLDDEGQGAVSNLIAAIEYVQQVNDYGRRLRIHGVNMSVGYGFDPEWFACGQSPLCSEVNRLVQSGVVVVVAAGNSGYGWLSTEFMGSAAAGMEMTINDPGNAELAITVGSTHREEPHVYGVSYFSSKGPTGDGRMKPDLVAPGEKIVSCAAGRNLLDPDGNQAGDFNYVEDSGTSMAAPHVSGVIAAFLSVRKEYLGQPEQVKEIFLSSATDLKRDPRFQGRGLVDLMRAILSV